MRVTFPMAIRLRNMSHVHRMEMVDVVLLGTFVLLLDIASVTRKVITTEVLVRMIHGEILHVLIIVSRMKIVLPPVP
jgi:hypothetical protein